MQNAALERIETVEMGYIRSAEMARCHDHMIEVLCVRVVFGQVADRDIEAGIGFLDPADRRFKADPIANASFFDPTLNVVEENGTGRV